MRRGGVAVSLACAASLALAACGARTTLDEPEGQGGASGSTSVASTSIASTTISSVVSTTAQSSSSGPPCTSDAECADALDCTIDFCAETGCAHQPDDFMCGDDVFCTTDVCDPDIGCVNVHSDAICDDGIACTSDACDASDDACHNDPCDSKCDDLAFCNGVERCDTALGCVGGPPTCDLDLACSVDSCSEASKKCSHGMTVGCAPNVHLLVTDSSGALVDLRPYTGFSTILAGANGGSHLDVAILPGPSPRWFALDFGNLFELTPGTNSILKVLPSPGDANSLAAGPDGFLYAAGSDVFRINANSGAAVTIGSLPPGEESSGDIAFYDGEMIISTDGPCGGGLAKFDLATGTSELLGGDGLGCVYGLAVTNGLLFLINCDGTIGTFQPSTGEAQILTTSTVTCYGADAL